MQPDNFMGQQKEILDIDLKINYIYQGVSNKVEDFLGYPIDVPILSMSETESGNGVGGKARWKDRSSPCDS